MVTLSLKYPRDAIPPRPTTDDMAVRMEALVPHLEAIERGSFTDRAHPEADIMEVFMTCDDPYHAAKLLEHNYNWDNVNMFLVRILDTVYSDMPTVCSKHVRAWTMKHGIRFPASEGLGISFEIDGQEFLAKVLGVIGCEARAVVRLLDASESDIIINVDAEEVHRVFHLGQSKVDYVGF